MVFRVNGQLPEDVIIFVTLPKFDSEFIPEKLPKPNRKGSSSNHYFSGPMLNFGGVYLFFLSDFDIKPAIWTHVHLCIQIVCLFNFKL